MQQTYNVKISQSSHCPTIPGKNSPFTPNTGVKGPSFLSMTSKDPDQVMDNGISWTDPPFMLLFMYVLGTASPQLPLFVVCVSRPPSPYFCCVFQVPKSFQERCSHAFHLAARFCEFFVLFLFYFSLLEKRPPSNLSTEKVHKGKQMENIKT